MSSKFWYLTKQSLQKKVATKWFVAVNILLAIAIVALLNINSIITFFGGDFNKDANILVIDQTNLAYPTFETTMKNLIEVEREEDDPKVEVKKTEKTEKEIKKKLKKNDVLVVFKEHDTDYVTASVISKDKLDSSTYQLITQGLNTAKTAVALTKTNIDPTTLMQVTKSMEINREVLNDKNGADENTQLIMNSVFPTIILPFFMLIIFLVQMIGGEICEEKTTKSMEIIISNVSAKTHLLSKVVASNLFVIGQALLLFIYGGIGLLISTKGKGLDLATSMGPLYQTLTENGFMDKLYQVIPLAIILMLLSFLAYSLVAGILASMTTNMEDFQQIQTPIMLVLLAGYYLAIMAGMFEGSSFIKILSYIPFLSCLISPSLFMMGQIGVMDIIISVGILIAFIYFLANIGLKVYKIGILNYSNEKIWSRFAKAIKSKDV